MDSTLHLTSRSLSIQLTIAELEHLRIREYLDSSAHPSHDAPLGIADAQCSFDESVMTSTTHDGGPQCEKARRSHDQLHRQVRRASRSAAAGNAPDADAIERALVQFIADLHSWRRECDPDAVAGFQALYVFR